MSSSSGLRFAPGQSPAASAPRSALRSAIIGTGDIAGEHAEAIVAAGAARVVLTGVADVDSDRAARFAADFGDVAVYSSLTEVIEAGEVDLVHLCTPSGTHVRLAEQVLRAGLTVLVEKPPAVSLRGIDHLIAVELETGGHVATVLQHRFSERVSWLERAIGAGRLGRPLVATCDTLWFRPDSYYEGSWHGRWAAEGGGPTLTLGIHQYDILSHLLGPWSTVTAHTERFRSVNEAEDVSAAVVRFQSGALASIVTSAVSPRQTSRLRVDLEFATIELEHLYGYDDTGWTFTPAAGHEALAEEWADIPSSPITGHSTQLAAVLEALEQGRPGGVTLEEVRQTFSLTTAVYASAFEGRTVTMRDLAAGSPYWGSLRGLSDEDLQ